MQYIAVSFGELNFAAKLLADKIHGLEAAILGLIDVLNLTCPLPAQRHWLHSHWDYGGEIDVQDGQVILFDGVLELKKCHDSRLLLENLKEKGRSVV